MLGTDVLLNIPTESVAVRAVVASVVGLLLVRLLLRRTLSLPRTRALAVLVPTVALLAAVVASWGAIDLPSLMVTSEAENVLAVPFGNGYLWLAPVTWPAALGVWAVVASLGVAVRLRRTLRTRRSAATLFTLRSASPARLTETVEVVAGRLRVTPPPIAVGGDVQGGASVVGIRRPVLLVDRTLLEGLDDEELEGLVAHELAHIRRRDNLVALLAGICRDLAFFVPGGRWVVRQLHAEREAAADALAVEVTGRPGALASGLLKTIESRRNPVAVGAAAFSPGSTLEARVRRLCVHSPTESRTRRLAESGAIAGAVAASVSIAISVPAWVANGGDQSRDVLAVLWSSRTVDIAEPPAEPAAFAVYRNTGFAGPRTLTVEEVSLVDDGRELNPALLRRDPIDGRSPAARVGWSVERRGLGITPAVSDVLGAEILEDWRATTLLQVEEGLGVYWLSRGN